jgi:hypothetical protein
MPSGYGRGGASLALQVQGEDQVRARIEGVREGLDGRQLRAANLEAARIMTAAAQATAPSRTGRLRGTVRARATSRTATVALGGPGVPYAGVIHWGTPDGATGRPSNIDANPWVSIAAQATEPEWTYAYWRYVQNLCDRG